MNGLVARTLSRGRRIVLRDVAFTPRPGTVTALCGPNGAGKTTLLRAMAGLDPGCPRPDPRRVAYVAQGAAAAWSMRVRDVVALGRLPHGDAAADPVAMALAAWDLDALADRRIDAVSGGEARRAMLARAFATQPAVLLLDEPVADLDPAQAHAAMRRLRDFTAAGGTVVAVLHATDLALSYADAIVCVADGRVGAPSPAAEAGPALAAAFGMRFAPDPSPRLLPR